MAAFKIAMVISLILALFIAQAPQMHAQEPIFGFIVDVVQVVISNLRRTATGLPVANTTSPIFSGALVQVRLGERSLGVGVTDRTGSTNITIIPALLLTDVTTLIRNVTVRVLTPVFNLTSGLLTSTLEVVGNTTVGLIRTTSLRPVNFTLTIA